MIDEHDDGYERGGVFVIYNLRRLEIGCVHYSIP